LKHCLAAHGLSAHFTTLQTADNHPSKPHPAMITAALAETGAGPGQTVMIGDTVFDMAMAQAAGVRGIGVDWGYHAATELLGAGAVAVAANPAQLEELMQ
jgi:phosphoglycolate phosphatase